MMKKLTPCLMMATLSIGNIASFVVASLLCCRTNFASLLERKPIVTGNRRFEFRRDQAIQAAALTKQGLLMLAMGVTVWVVVLTRIPLKSLPKSCSGVFSRRMRQ